MASLKLMMVCAVLLMAAITTTSARLYLLEVDDGQLPNLRPAVRVRRSPHEGVVGPVYTHVKTDKHANFKWGVKHHVGKQYAG